MAEETELLQELQELKGYVQDLRIAVFGFGSGNGLLQDTRRLRQDMERRQREEEIEERQAEIERKRDRNTRIMVGLGGFSALVAAVGVVWQGVG